MSDYKEKIAELLSNPDNLIRKKPFTRGATDLYRGNDRDADIGQFITPELPSQPKYVVNQSEFLRELDPNSHKVLFDDNIPSITMKTKDGGFVTIEYKRMAVPFQKMIKNKQVLHLCGNPMQFTLMDLNPTEQQRRDFITFKQYWEMRNQDGMRTKAVNAQKSVGDAGLLYYFDYKGQIKSRLLSYMDGYVLCPQNDENGDRIMECVYYKKDNVEYLDCYDDTYIYRFTKGQEDMTLAPTVADAQWKLSEKTAHGFSEIPLVSKRGDVAWNDVQNIIEVYEVIYNIFLVIQKRHGWGILYIRGNFNEDGRKINGAIVLNDTSIDGNGSAEYKTPPNPQGMLDTLDKMEETIQKGSGTTFLLPKDIKMSGDISGIAIQLTQSLDNEKSLESVIEYQNFADKMTRVFKEGLAKELVSKDIQPTAVTDFQNLHISGAFKAWRPRNDIEYNNMLAALSGAGLISYKTGIEKNTESTPDELKRINEQKTLEDERAKVKESINITNVNEE